jgi:hypothetical protein
MGMNTDCDNSTMIEASGQNDLLPETDPQSNQKSRKQTWLKRSAIVVAIAIAGWFWFNPPLNSEEQKLVGRWTHSASFPTGATSNRVMTYNSNRSWILKDVTTFPAAIGKPAEVREGASFGKWKIKNGRIYLIPNRSPRNSADLLVRRVLNVFTGNKFIDGELSEGKIRFLSTHEARMQWYDPVTEKYDASGETHWKRIE